MMCLAALPPAILPRPGVWNSATWQNEPGNLVPQGIALQRQVVPHLEREGRPDGKRRLLCGCGHIGGPDTPVDRIDGFREGQ